MYRGGMTPDQFMDSGKRLFGRSAWQGELADALGINRTTIWRYSRGKREIPERVALALEALESRRAA